MGKERKFNRGDLVKFKNKPGPLYQVYQTGQHFPSARFDVRLKNIKTGKVLMNWFREASLCCYGPKEIAQERIRDG